jgi:hypothetical protein
MSVLNSVLRLLKKEEEQLNRELTAITAAVAAFGKTYVNGTSARRLSAGGRTPIGAPQKAQRAKARKTSKVIPMKSKPTPSSVARKKVEVAQKARSAKTKAAKKSA